jgi:Fe-S cluster assembly ATPase SufC
MSILDPKLSILDETDSGLDIDALRIVSEGVNSLRNRKIFFNYYSLSKIIRLYQTRLCPCFKEWKNN